jgi:hypothetical protein
MCHVASGATTMLPTVMTVDITQCTKCENPYDNVQVKHVSDTASTHHSGCANLHQLYAWNINTDDGTGRLRPLYAVS